MKQICKYLGFITLVLGVIGSIALANKFGVETSFSSLLSDFEITRNWLTTIIYFLSGLLSTGILSSILFGIAEILERIESIEYSSNNASNHQESFTDSPDSYWVCPNCAKHNPLYTGTCGCGCKRP